jgi:ISPg7, transposase
VVGDAVNLLLAAAAYNFKRAMRALLTLLKIISEMLSENSSSNNFSLGNAF